MEILRGTLNNEANSLAILALKGMFMQTINPPYPTSGKQTPELEGGIEM